MPRRAGWTSHACRHVVRPAAGAPADQWWPPITRCVPPSAMPAASHTSRTRRRSAGRSRCCWKRWPAAAPQSTPPRRARRAASRRRRPRSSAAPRARGLPVRASWTQHGGAVLAHAGLESEPAPATPARRRGARPFRLHRPRRRQPAPRQQRRLRQAAPGRLPPRLHRRRQRDVDRWRHRRRHAERAAPAVGTPAHAVAPGAPAPAARHPPGTRPAARSRLTAAVPLMLMLTRAQAKFPADVCRRRRRWPCTEPPSGRWSWGASAPLRCRTETRSSSSSSSKWP